MKKLIHAARKLLEQQVANALEDGTKSREVANLEKVARIYQVVCADQHRNAIVRDLFDAAVSAPHHRSHARSVATELDVRGDILSRAVLLDLSRVTSALIVWCCCIEKASVDTSDSDGFTVFEAA